MNIIEPESFEDFLTFINNPNHNFEKAYRGQADSSLSLIAGIGRNTKLQNGYDILKIEQWLLVSFQKMIFDSRLENLVYVSPNGYHKDWQWWMIAQHYGLPTRLLDFSDDQYYALQFAISDTANLDKDGALFIYTKDDTYRGPDHPTMRSPINISESSFMFQVPKYYGGDHENLSFRRQLLQRSKFFFINTNSIFKCLSEDELHSKNFIKIIIKKKIKLDVIKYLIKEKKFDYDPYLYKNKIDLFAAIIKEDFMKENSKFLLI